MRVSRFAIIAALATMAIATEKQEYKPLFFKVPENHPVVEASSIFPVDGWGITDWVVGLIIGAYTPLQDRWRNGDCRAKFYNFGINTIGYSKFFDQPFDVNSVMTWFNLITALGVTGINIWHVVEVCGAQLRNTYTDPWYLNFNLLSDDFTPKV